MVKEDLLQDLNELLFDACVISIFFFFEKIKYRKLSSLEQSRRI